MVLNSNIVEGKYTSTLRKQFIGTDMELSAHIHMPLSISVGRVIECILKHHLHTSTCRCKQV